MVLDLFKSSRILFILLFVSIPWSCLHSILFSYTGTSTTYTIPSGTQYIEAELWGAAGGDYGPKGGRGGYIKAQIAVSAGQVLYIFVGGKGASPGYCNVGGAGYNGGGKGICGGGGGGGSSDIRLNKPYQNRTILVAGGGGGGGYYSSGGCGGGTIACSTFFSTGGTQAYGGRRALIVNYAKTGWDNSGNGTAGKGSDAAACGTDIFTSGGGGGGGWYGGGGGVCDHGGGGGSSYYISSALLLNNTRGVNSGNGYIKITLFGGLPSSQPSTQPSSQPSRQPSRRPTAQPSTSPSCQPSRQPSSKPTMQPTQQPSAHPTSQPSANPSRQPSCQPSRQPTSQPTSSFPTGQPSRQPTKQPMGFPTSRPTSQPIASPSSQPTGQPTFPPSTQPTSIPSSLPTTMPSIFPTSIPSNHPSSYPTNQPTCNPTSQPSSRPTKQPSQQPSSQPSSYPSVSPSSQPTSQPTHFPSAQPSLQPSNQPTNQPTTNPSSYPSSCPTRQPSLQPTSFPSLVPSTIPTSQPSYHPSTQPSDQPSLQPTTAPTAQPSTLPTSFPTAQPTDSPSVSPSIFPSTQPTALPSNQPTSHPTGQPSSCPSNQPFATPTSQPSTSPTTFPTSQPISYPTVNPSSQPTNFPTGQPSDIPTYQPSVHPSPQPTNFPSSQPSVQPVSHPTLQPSIQPTVIPTTQPSNYPTMQPTIFPTSQPSILPTVQPSRRPTDSPSSQPSSKPSLHPSTQPSRQPTSQPSQAPISTPTSHPSVAPTLQPSSFPTSQPTDSPSSVPTVSPSIQPSRQPISVPSGQPTMEPTRQPSCQPSTKPSVHPTQQPSAQPFAAPTKAPSSQPTNFPTSQPSSEPSNTPSRQPVGAPTCQPTSNPTSYPSTQPSSQPTLPPLGFPTVVPSSQPSVLPSSGPTAMPNIDPNNCPTTSFFSEADNKCYNCTTHSHQVSRGSVTCTCDDGFRQYGEGLSLNCTICPVGYYSVANDPVCSQCLPGTVAPAGSKECLTCPEGSFALADGSECALCPAGSFASTTGNEQCTLCPLGSYSTSEGSVECIFCPQGSYADISGQAKCTPCGPSEITPGVGATSNTFCVNPAPNFAIGGITLFLSFIAVYIYLAKGRLNNVAFKRKVLFVFPLAKVCNKLQQRLDDQLLIADQTIRQQSSKYSKYFRITLFLILTLFILSFVTFLNYLTLFYKTFYNALFLLRGLTEIVTVAPILNTLKNALIDLGNVLHLPKKMIDYIFYPAYAIVNVLSVFSINLDTISVTCEGSKAPAEVVVNFMILGIVMSILMSGYQYLWMIIFPNLNSSFLKMNLLLRRSNDSLLNPLLCLIGVIGMSINPFEAFVRFLMTLGKLQRFFENNGSHSITPSCDDVVIFGFHGIHTLLSVNSTVLVWLLLLPLVYIISGILVPRCVIRNETEIIRLPHEDLLLTPKQTRSLQQYSRKKFQIASKIQFTSIVPTENAMSNARTRFPRLSIRTATKAQGIANRNACLTILNRYRNKIFTSIQSMISVDIIVISLITRWLEFLGKRHGLNEVSKLHHDSSDEDDEIDDDMNENTTIPKIAPEAVGWKEKISLVKTAHHQQLTEKRLRYAYEDEATYRNTTLSSYHDLCYLVTTELRKRYKLPILFAMCLSWLGLGHFITRVGKIHWKLVLRKYYMFLCACLGVWSDEVVASFAFEETTCALYINKPNVVTTDDHDIYRSLLYINVGMKSIVLQIFPIMTIVSVIIASFSSTPLFVTSKQLANKLPNLLIYDAWNIAIEMYILNQGLESYDNLYWLVWLGSISIFITKSRLLSFVSNFLALCIPVLTLYYNDQTKKILVVVLILLFPFVCARTLDIIIIIGRQLRITDDELRCLLPWYWINLKPQIVVPLAISDDKKLVDDVFSGVFQNDSTIDVEIHNNDDDYLLTEVPVFCEDSEEEGIEWEQVVYSDYYKSESSNDNNSCEKDGFVKQERKHSLNDSLYGFSVFIDSNDEGEDVDIITREVFATL